MLFTGIEFLFLFLPLVLAGYCLLPFRWNLKNYWLLAASLGFYAWGEPSFVFVMLASVAGSFRGDGVARRRRLYAADLLRLQRLLRHGDRTRVQRDIYVTPMPKGLVSTRLCICQWGIEKIPYSI